MQFVDLIHRARGGDSRAFSDLIGQFQGMAYGYAYVLLGDTHLAQDATQEAFLDTYMHLASIRAPEAFPSWLRRVVFKHCDRLKRRKKFQTVSLELAVNIADGSPLPDAKLVAEETHREALAALESLPESERAVMILHELRGYPQREVAVFLEIPLYTVKNRLRSARRKLAERILEMVRQVLWEDPPNLQEQWQQALDLRAACESGDVETAVNILQTRPGLLEGPDCDDPPYHAHAGWSPVMVAARHGQVALLRLLLDMGANPVPQEVAGRYHDYHFLGWLNELREREQSEAAALLQDAIQARYGSLVDDANIHEVVRKGELDRTRALLDEQPDRVRQIDATGNTPLHWAVESKHLDVARLLIERGAPIDARRGDGRTPSIIAVLGMHTYWRREWKPEIFQYLLDQGAEYTCFLAAATGDLDAVRRFVSDNSSCVHERDPIWLHPLTAATYGGFVEVVKTLLEAGADPNARDKMYQGGGSLHSASMQGNIEIARMLLEHGANPSHWMDSSGTPMMFAQQHADMLQLMYGYGGVMDITLYSHRHRLDMVAEMLNLQPSLADDVLPFGWADGGSEEVALAIMRLAIRYGARYENESEWKLRRTLRDGYFKVFRLLMEYGASPNPCLAAIAGDMARRYSGEEEQLKYLRFLLEECGADVNTIDKDGFTPLANASRAGCGLLVAYLLFKGANVNPPGESWAKPLHLAEKGGHTEIADRLRQLGAR
ncbi:MAG: sigma-70 family RNA polymerase sigma factor [Candidatus Poribacteria bacterium]|nr:sigma-70 family RNA polymerase sigma factor [Candidatus Poribacteria bacterium]